MHVKDSDKIEPLLKMVSFYRKHSHKNNTSCIIFCNTIASARKVEHAIAEKGYRTSSLHGEVPKYMRNKQYMDFKNQKTKILVATDLASRGLDHHFVSHVINFDFPYSASDYLHRAGRAGRAGREGFVYNLYRNKDHSLIK